MSKYQAHPGKEPRFVAGFDSASVMVKSLGAFLRGHDFSGVGVMPNSQWAGDVINALPLSFKKVSYSRSGIFDAIPAKDIPKIDTEELAKWVTQLFPERKYPAIMIGSSNGALTHVAAALQIPWLPQTFLIPVRKPQNLHIDQPKQYMQWGYPYGEELLRLNPGIELHHMTDPNQDRLHLKTMTYFRIKKRRLGVWYEYFLKQNLTPGGTIIVNECTCPWPARALNDRHYFQFGGTGGASPKEYYQGSDRVTDLLRRHKSPYDHWDAPEPTGEYPEAEWGFAPQLLDDLERFARENGFRVQRIRFSDMHDVSGLTADMYRSWYRQRNMPANRLLVESFALLTPYWTLRTGSVPYWLVFNTDPSADRLEKYLQNSDFYDQRYLMLLSHGTEGIGLTPIERWRMILDSEKNAGEFIGTKPKEYPFDFGVYARYNHALQNTVSARYPIAPMSLAWFEEYMRNHADQHKVSWSAVSGAEAPAED
uniref:Uncharacterized protein n=1 Tax=Roseihalotalea indica TaxID=2867963 RepID=A0AA49JE81_9BACT|nr:hypothetical protein K4G66_03300 [Tunicatimonas sp. TK19036]